MLGTLLSRLNGLLLLTAFVLGGLAVWERLANHFGYTSLHGYAPWRLLAYAAVVLLFVIALELRGIREQRR